MSNYRAIGHNSSVDESLFGNNDNKSGHLNNKNTRTKFIATGPLPPSSVVISADELNKILSGSIIKTDAELAADREKAEQIREEKQKLSKERKLRMKELEQRSVLLAKKSDVELAEMSKQQAIREAAEKKLVSNADPVKLLNSMAQRAIAFTIRDQQLEEKRRLEQIEKEYEERMNISVEIDRIKDIKRREEEESYKKAKRIEDRKVINQQIAERERERMLTIEAREQENLAMRNLMKKYKEEDTNDAIKRAHDMEESRKAIIIANERAIELKKLAKEAERKELDDILLYQSLKDKEILKREEENAIIALSKKEREIKLLLQQEKAQNNAGKLDELRARRAAEEKERNERRKEKSDALKKKDEIKNLLESRSKQAADKLERSKLAKLQADEMLLLDLQYTKKMDEREYAEKQAKYEKSHEHKIKLQSQIEDRARARAMNVEIDDGSNVHQQLIKEEAKLKVIRDQMVQDMITQGINPKYLSEMRNVDIGKILKR